MSKFEWFPPVDTVEHAQKAARQGFWCAVFVSAVTAVVSLLAILVQQSILGYDGWNLIDALIFALVAWGIRGFSRFWAWIGLLLWSVGLIQKVLDLFNGSSFRTLSFVSVIILLGLISGVRGTAAYRKLSADTITHVERL
ncbi:MAG: hypothetical protein C5B54_04280 [Acidobacteria bacterium]|nr:MAG: hypothetical protein C5B54_04280 [Acidobacteriota bacterium]